MAIEITLDDLQKMIEKDIQDVLRVIAEKTAKKLYQIVENDWYTQHGHYGEWYDRTYDFLRSITKSSVKKVGNNFEIEIYFDSDKIKSQFGEPGKFNAHMSLNKDTSWGGQDISEWLIQWIEEGQNSPINPEHGIHMVKETREWLNQELNGLVMREFREKGFDIKVL